MRTRKEWTELELWLLKQSANTGEPRYQDAATLLRQQREALAEADASVEALRYPARRYYEFIGVIEPDKAVRS